MCLNILRKVLQVDIDCKIILSRVKDRILVVPKGMFVWKSTIVRQSILNYRPMIREKQMDLVQRQLQVSNEISNPNAANTKLNRPNSSIKEINTVFK